MTSTGNRTIALAALALAILLVAAFVWPTRYRYVAADGVRSATTARIDRFSGDTQMIYDGAWIAIGRPGGDQ